MAEAKLPPPLVKVAVTPWHATGTYRTDLVFEWRGRFYGTRVPYAVKPSEYQAEVAAFLKRREADAIGR